MAENQATKNINRGNPQNQPRRERFAFNKINSSVNLQQQQTSTSNTQEETVKGAKGTQIFLKMPTDYREGYVAVVNQLAALFNEIREELSIFPSELLYITQLRNLLDKIGAVEDIHGCIEILRRTALSLIDVISQTALYDYETLLQETEAKVRDHIRNELQLKVALESLQFKLDDLEKNSKFSESQYNHKIEKLIADKSLLSSTIENKDAEIHRLIKELAQKSQLIDMQNKTITKSASETNTCQNSSRNANERSVPKLFGLKSADYRPIYHSIQTTVSRGGLTPSPMRTQRTFKDQTLENSQPLVVKVCYNTSGTNLFVHTLTRKSNSALQKREFSEAINTPNLGQITTEDTAETLNPGILNENKNEKRSFHIFNDNEKLVPYMAVPKERHVQTERTFTNLSHGSVTNKDSLIKASKSPQKLESSKGNKQKTKALLDLEKIFKIKRQNNSTMDLKASDQNRKMQRNPTNGSENYLSSERIKQSRDHSAGKKDSEDNLVTYNTYDGRQKTNSSYEANTKNKRPSSNNSRSTRMSNMSLSKSLQTLKQQLTAAKGYKY